MSKEAFTRGHIHETILDKVLSDQYLTAMCIEDFISSMSEKELDKWKKNFFNYDINSKQYITTYLFKE